ncbi:MAG TPA: hypothetical protein VG755_39300 [Nannocystaceae bacterium]|nr:hypothetical protein [Nannocystaceae bacterium]
MTKRLRLTFTGNAETATATVTFTRVEDHHWQATTAYEGVCHASAGHHDERTALLSVTRWLRERMSVPHGTTTVVGIAGLPD